MTQKERGERERKKERERERRVGRGLHLLKERRGRKERRRREKKGLYGHQNIDQCVISVTKCSNV